MEFNRPIARQRARRLRRDQTDAEQALWARLRDRQLFGAKFRRQHPIGHFVADFCCPQRKLVVELDGGQHAARVAADQKRARFLQEQGYRVLRFWNHDVLGEHGGSARTNCRGPELPSPLPSPWKGEGEERPRSNSEIK
jgi:very-short-patch-repair endonuclease